MKEKIGEFLGDSDNHRKIRYIGFSMAVVGLLAGIAAAITAGVIGSGGLGICAAGVTVLSFALFPVTDINYPRRGIY